MNIDCCGAGDDNNNAVFGGKGFGGDYHKHRFKCVYSFWGT